MRSALDAVSDGFKNLQSSMRPATRGVLEPTLDHPLATPAPGPGPTFSEDRGQAHAQAETRPQRNSSGGRDGAQAAGERSAAGRWGSSGASSSGQVDSDWCDLGGSAAGALRGGVFDDRVRQFQREVQGGGAMDMRNVRALAFDGVPDRDGLRAIVWKVMRP